MKRDRYMGIDLHQATSVVVVLLNSEGRPVLETIVPNPFHRTDPIGTRALEPSAAGRKISATVSIVLPPSYFSSQK